MSINIPIIKISLTKISKLGQVPIKNFSRGHDPCLLLGLLLDYKVLTYIAIAIYASANHPTRI